MTTEHQVSERSTESALESLAKQAEGARWLRIDEGRQTLLVPLKALLTTESAILHWHDSAPNWCRDGTGHLSLLSEAPEASLLQALDSAVRPRPALAWPRSVGQREPAGLLSVGRLEIGSTDWVLAIGQEHVGKSRLAGLGPAPSPDPEELAEDLDARARWFKQRH